MADWPGLDELKQVLDIVEDHWDGDADYGDPTRLERVRLAAIDRVKADVGDWDVATDVPDEALAHAALRMAELLALKPEDAAAAAADPTYAALLRGHRRRWGFA